MWKTTRVSRSGRMNISLFLWITRSFQQSCSQQNARYLTQMNFIMVQHIIEYCSSVVGRPSAKSDGLGFVSLRNRVFRLNTNLFFSFRVGVRACVVLTPLLGVTWLIGFLSPLHIAFSYMFVILNSTQVKYKAKGWYAWGATSRGMLRRISKKMIIKLSKWVRCNSD